VAAWLLLPGGCCTQSLSCEISTTVAGDKGCRVRLILLLLETKELCQIIVPHCIVLQERRTG
jgi:hypothetical protein